MKKYMFFAGLIFCFLSTFAQDRQYLLPGEELSIFSLDPDWKTVWESSDGKFFIIENGGCFLPYKKTETGGIIPISVLKEPSSRTACASSLGEAKGVIDTHKISQQKKSLPFLDFETTTRPFGIGGPKQVKPAI